MIIPPNVGQTSLTVHPDVAGTGCGRAERAAAIPAWARVWIALAHTDMRKGIQGLALLVQQGLKADPPGGDLLVSRGRSGSLAAKPTPLLFDLLHKRGMGRRVKSGRSTGRVMFPISLALHSHARSAQRHSHAQNIGHRSGDGGRDRTC